MRAYLIQAEHWFVPGRRMAVAFGEAAANAQARAWTNELIADVQPDGGYPFDEVDAPDLVPDGGDWKEGLRALAKAMLINRADVDSVEAMLVDTDIDDLLDDREYELPSVWIELVDVLDEPPADERSERAQGETFAYEPDRCPTKHYNRGDDICGDCGAELN